MAVVGVSQLTVYAKILCLLMTLFSAGASTGEDAALQSACSLKFIRVKNGSVFTEHPPDDGQPQVFSRNAIKTSDNRAAVTIYSKETDSYICFDKNWRIKSMRGKANMSRRRCMFFEKFDASAGLRFDSVVNKHRSLGFQRNGKPIRGVRAGGGTKVGPDGVVRNRTIDELCFSFHSYKPSGQAVPQQHSPTLNPQPQRPEVKVTRPQQQRKQQGNQLQPRQRHHRQQDQRKGAVSAGEGANALLTSGYSGGPSDQRQSPPHRHRHKHGAGGRQGKLQQQGHPNLDNGFTGATSSLPTATLASLHGGNSNAYGKGTHHRRSHLNSPVPGDAAMLPAALSALVTKLPPKSSAHAAHLGPTLGLLDAGGPGGMAAGGGGGGGVGVLYRKDRPAMEPPNGRVSSGHLVGANGKKKSPNGNNGTSGRNASTKVSAMRGRDKRASG